jgi:hypothetical protein
MPPPFWGQPHIGPPPGPPPGFTPRGPPRGQPPALQTGMMMPPMGSLGGFGILPRVPPPFGTPLMGMNKTMCVFAHKDLCRGQIRLFSSHMPTVSSDYHVARSWKLERWSPKKSKDAASMIATHGAAIDLPAKGSSQKADPMAIRHPSRKVHPGPVRADQKLRLRAVLQLRMQ